MFFIWIALIGIASFIWSLWSLRDEIVSAGKRHASHKKHVDTEESQIHHTKPTSTGTIYKG